MPAQGYSEGDLFRVVQEVSIAPQITAGKIHLYTVPDNYLMRWRFIHYILTINTGDLTFRGWFINVVSPNFGDAGQFIPGLAAVGGAGPITTSPIHELLDCTSAVFFDSVFQGGGGVQPLWDYSGLSSVWWPGGYVFEIDASQLVAGDRFDEINGMVELTRAVDDPDVAAVYKGKSPFLIPSRSG